MTERRIKMREEVSGSEEVPWGAVGSVREWREGRLVRVMMLAMPHSYPSSNSKSSKIYDKVHVVFFIC